MAVTIEQNPYQYLNLSGNPIVWVFSSDQTGQPNFTFYIELYINGVLDSAHEVVLESGTLGKFDASKYAENNTTVPTLPADILGADPLNSSTLYLIVNERYGATPTLEASAATGKAFTIKGKKEFEDWLVFQNNVSDYVEGQGANDFFLTEDPSISIREGEQLYFSIVFDGDGNLYAFETEYFNAAGTSLQVLNSFNESLFANDMVALTYDYIETNYTGAGTFADVAYIQVNAKTSVAKTITIDRSCRLETYQVHFLSQLGGVDSFTFNRLGTQTMTTTAKSMQTNRGGFSGSAFVWDGLNSGKGNYQVNAKKKLKLTSDWIDEDKKEFLLNNMAMSPWVILETASGQLRIANTGGLFKFNKKPFDTLFNIEMTIDKGTHTSMTV